MHAVVMVEYAVVAIYVLCQACISSNHSECINRECNNNISNNSSEQHSGYRRTSISSLDVYLDVRMAWKEEQSSVDSLYEDFLIYCVACLHCSLSFMYVYQQSSMQQTVHVCMHHRCCWYLVGCVG